MTYAWEFDFSDQLIEVKKKNIPKRMFNHQSKKINNQGDI